MKAGWEFFPGLAWPGTVAALAPSSKPTRRMTSAYTSCTSRWRHQSVSEMDCRSGGKGRLARAAAPGIRNTAIAAATIVAAARERGGLNGENAQARGRIRSVAE